MEPDDSTIDGPASIPRITGTINVPVPDVPESNMSICSHRSKNSRSTQSNYVTIEQFEDLKQNMATKEDMSMMATKEDISMIAQALAKLAMKDTDPHLENRGTKHKDVPETEYIWF